MIGIVLVGHMKIASEMLAAMEHVVGKQPLMSAQDVIDSNPEDIRTSLAAKIKACDIGKGTLLLADMFGGTPCNIAMGYLQPHRVEVVSGFNLPLLIKAATLRHTETDLHLLAERVVQSGRMYMCTTPKKHDQNHEKYRGTQHA